MADTITLKDKRLKDLIRAFKGRNPPVAQVGILGDKNSRNDSLESNATIGAMHEFGTSKLPIRSFLRMPLTTQLSKQLEASGAFSKDAFERVGKEASLLEWVKKLAVVGEQVVLESFNTGGFGQWIPSDMLHKKVHQTLVETQQLRNSISSRVEENP